MQLDDCPSAFWYHFLSFSYFHGRQKTQPHYIIFPGGANLFAISPLKECLKQNIKYQNFPIAKAQFSPKKGFQFFDQAPNQNFCFRDIIVRKNIDFVPCIKILIDRKCQ